MAAGWKNLWDNIEYVRDNKPGSANHAYRSFMYRTMFNVDASLKDDGTEILHTQFLGMKKTEYRNCKKYNDTFGVAKLFENMNDENKKSSKYFCGKSRWI